MVGATATVSSPDDLTAKARIRNAALDLFAEHGERGTSMRAVASAADVTVGLLVHHYGTKDGLREAVESHIVALFADAISSVPAALPARDVVAARDAAVAEMLRTTPAVVDYLRRALLGAPGHSGDVLGKLTALTAEQVELLREEGLVSTRHSVTEQVIITMVRQLGQLFLQPLVDRIIDEFGESSDGESKPELLVGIKD